MLVGIIAAEEKEMLSIKNKLEDIEELVFHNQIFYKGVMCDKDVVLVQCGVGKVNSSRVCQLMIDYFNIDYMINMGVAGGIDFSLNIGDIVIGEKLIQYDFDARAVGDYELGEICDTGKYFCSSEKLVQLVKSVDKYRYKVKSGIIGTADIFMSNKEYAEKLNKELCILCVEMEGAAIAQVCTLNKIPFIVIRGISDVQNGNNKVDFQTYLEIVSVQAAEIVDSILQGLV